MLMQWPLATFRVTEAAKLAEGAIRGGRCFLEHFRKGLSPLLLLPSCQVFLDEIPGHDMGRIVGAASSKLVDAACPLVGLLPPTPPLQLISLVTRELLLSVSFVK